MTASNPSLAPNPQHDDIDPAATALTAAEQLLREHPTLVEKLHRAGYLTAADSDPPAESPVADAGAGELWRSVDWEELALALEERVGPELNADEINRLYLAWRLLEVADQAAHATELTYGPADPTTGRQRGDRGVERQVWKATWAGQDSWWVQDNVGFLMRRDGEWTGYYDFKDAKDQTPWLFTRQEAAAVVRHIADGFGRPGISETAVWEGIKRADTAVRAALQSLPDLRRGLPENIAFSGTQNCLPRHAEGAPPPAGRDTGVDDRAPRRR
jgi:hypothetical protein